MPYISLCNIKRQTIPDSSFSTASNETFVELRRLHLTLKITLLDSQSLICVRNDGTHLPVSKHHSSSLHVSFRPLAYGYSTVRPRSTQIILGPLPRKYGCVQFLRATSVKTASMTTDDWSVPVSWVCRGQPRLPHHACHSLWFSKDSSLPSHCLSLHIKSFRAPPSFCFYKYRYHHTSGDDEE